ncbi:MAG: hypothetical protein KDB23_04075 [Planctomycetales bacterium]|nr:hypothetical protein [Planctomycetales bacterium]
MEIIFERPSITVFTRNQEYLMTDRLTATQMLTQLRAGHVSSLELTQQAIERIAAVNPALNALVVDRFEAALADARAADDRWQAIRQAGHADENAPLLLGVPVTVKEMFDVQGMATTVGIQRRRALLATRDAEVVRRWRAQGAIILGKTNVPQMGAFAETDNPVYGRTNNPWNLERTCGGSSGGDAALVGAGATALALASDGGGSIRLPSHACGAYGFKPTGGQLPMSGHWMSMNWPSDWGQPGPIAASVTDLELGWRALQPEAPDQAIYGEVPQDPRVSSLSLLSDVKRPLRVGVYDSLPELPACDAVRRAVRMAADTLQSLGAELIPFEFPRAGDGWEIYMTLFYAEGLRDMQRQVRGSAVDPRIRELFRFARLPRRLRPVIARAYAALGQRRVAQLLRDVDRPVQTAETYCRRLLEMHAYRQHFARRWRRANLDVLLGPVAPAPAYRHNEFFANYALIYTGLYNLLGMPAGAVPVTLMTEQESQQVLIASRDPVDAALQRAVSGGAGLPLAVQIAGFWWQDAKVLQVMRLLNEHLTLPAVPEFT